MSIFGGRTTTTTHVDVPVYEGYKSEFNGDLLAVQEGYEDQLAIIEAIHTLDMEDLDMRRDVKALQESGASDLEISERMEKFDSVTESMAGNVWAKIKTFFANMLGKLKAFFASVIRFFDGMFKSGKDFATKYEKQLRALNLSGFEYKMFEYTHLEGDKAANFLTTAENVLAHKFSLNTDTSAEAIEAALDKYEEEKEETFNALRGTYCGGSNLEKDEYTEGLYRHFRNGAKDEGDKVDVKINIGEIITTLKDSKSLKAAEDALKDCDKVFTKKLADIAKLEKGYQKFADHKNNDNTGRGMTQKLVAEAQKQASAFSEAKTIALEYFRAWKEAVTARNSDYKSVCTSAFRYKKKEA